MNKNNGYVAKGFYFHIDQYIIPDGDEEWCECPYCGLRPKVWIFDNESSTACGCWENRYDHFSIHSESIMSVYSRTNGKNMIEYDSDDLRKNWNHWCKTGDMLFEKPRKDGRW